MDPYWFFDEYCSEHNLSDDQKDTLYRDGTREGYIVTVSGVSYIDPTGRDEKVDTAFRRTQDKRNRRKKGTGSRDLSASSHRGVLKSAIDRYRRSLATYRKRLESLREISRTSTDRIERAEAEDKIRKLQTRIEDTERQLDICECRYLELLSNGSESDTDSLDNRE